MRTRLDRFKADIDRSKQFIRDSGWTHSEVAQVVLAATAWKLHSTRVPAAFGATLGRFLAACRTTPEGSATRQRTAAAFRRAVERVGRSAAAEAGR